MTPTLPPPDHAFFIIPRNRDYLLKRTSVLSVPNPLEQGKSFTAIVFMYSIVMLLIIALVRVLVGGDDFSPATNVAWILGTGIVFILIIFSLTPLNNRRVTRRMATSGQLLPGTIQQARGEIRNSGHRGRKRHHLLVDYTFTAPDGSVHTATREEIYDDLNNPSIPTPQTPVYILYFTPKEFYLL